MLSLALFETPPTSQLRFDLYYQPEQSPVWSIRRHFVPLRCSGRIGFVLGAYRDHAAGGHCDIERQRQFLEESRQAPESRSHGRPGWCAAGHRRNQRNRRHAPDRTTAAPNARQLFHSPAAERHLVVETVGRNAFDEFAFARLPRNGRHDDRRDQSEPLPKCRAAARGRRPPNRNQRRMGNRKNPPQHGNSNPALSLDAQHFSRKILAQTANIMWAVS